MAIIQLTKEQILAERKVWYNFLPVKFEIIKILKNRELAFLTKKGQEKKMAIRYILAFNISYLDKHFKRFDIEKNLMNLYHSVAKLKDIPVFSWNVKERRHTEEYQEFNEHYANYVVGYNFFVDFDGKENFEKCFAEAKEFKKILDEYHLPYYCLNSSFNGFHFVIPCEYMPQMEIKELLILICNVLYNIKGIYDFTTMDISITDLKRLQKVPYSYECSGAICLPLSDEMFSNFTPNMVKMRIVLDTIIIKNRGLKIRTWGLSDEQLKINVTKFLDDFK